MQLVSQSYLEHGVEDSRVACQFRLKVLCGGLLMRPGHRSSL